ncbi:MAG: alpha/beta hydrolase [Bacteroidales bacterium]|jgi:pimeloyl-ACP methyl ester carboxylesterase|nr:alpha/beta hydrolase [Bacteroidales bacterium]
MKNTILYISPSTQDKKTWVLTFLLGILPVIIFGWLFFPEYIQYGIVENIHWCILFFLFLSISVAGLACTPNQYVLTDKDFIIKRYVGNIHIPLDKIKAVRFMTDAEEKKMWRSFGYSGPFGRFGLFSTKGHPELHLFARRSNHLAIIATDHIRYVVAPDDLLIIDKIAEKTGQQEISDLMTGKTGTRQRVFRTIPYVVIGLVLLLIWIGYRDPKVSINEDVFKMSGLYGIQIPINEITKTDTITREEMPAISMRTNGFGMPGVQRGNYQLTTGEKVRLSLKGNMNPVIRMIDQGGQAYYFNFKDPGQTRNVFSRLKAVTALSENNIITGQWNSLMGNLRLIFHIRETDNKLSATMDSPDQKANDIPVTTIVFDGSRLSLGMPNIGLKYEGEWQNDSIIGIFEQNGFKIPLNLYREITDIKTVKRPQDPVKPYPYSSEDITFRNDHADITLAGTLTIPKEKGNFPAVILISGSGAQDRNEEILNHRPFLVIADYLTRNGIAVLRYDDRGTAQSTGNFSLATTEDLATDVESAITYLKTRKEINHKKIGLIGHSEGGIIAPMVAVKSKDVDFIILLAGSGIRGDSILLMQTELIAKASGVPEKEIRQSSEINSTVYECIVNNSGSVADLKKDIKNIISEAVKSGKITLGDQESTAEDQINKAVMSVTNPWMLYFIKYDPSIILQKVTCPVFALNGKKDLQVPSERNLSAIKNALEKGGNDKVTVKEYPGLNHLFQECETGSPSEYAIIEQTFSPVVLEDISDWILEQTK